jgi:hypothetical protein
LQDDALIVLLATLIADGIVGVGWLGLAAVVVVLLRARVRMLLAAEPDAPDEPEGAVRWLCFGGSLLFWPAGVILTILFLQKAATARAGQVCAWMLLAYVSASVVLAIAIVTVGAAMFPALLVR